MIEKSGSTRSLNETPKGTPTEIKEELSLADKKDTLYDYQSEDYDIPSDDGKLLDRLCRVLAILTVVLSLGGNYVFRKHS